MSKARKQPDKSGGKNPAGIADALAQAKEVLESQI
jgi:hypothetical protein